MCIISMVLAGLDVQVTAARELFVWWVGGQRERGEWRRAMVECGVQCVAGEGEHGQTQMPI